MVNLNLSNPSVVDMSYLVWIVITSVSAVFFRLLSKGSGAKKLPGGSLGFPILGETLSFLKAQRDDKGPEWLSQRISKHGPIFKTSLMGSPTMVIVGQAGNKFVLGADDDVLAAKQPLTIQKISGKKTIFELTGSRYRLVKSAMVSFLKPESLQNYIAQMDDLVKTLFLEETKGKDIIKAVVFMKKITFNVACNILFGIQDELTKAAFFDDFTLAFKAVWSLPVNLPGTVFWRGLEARKRIVDRFLPIMEERKELLSKGLLSPTSDVLCSLLALRDENQEPLTQEEVIDNLFTLMIASHDTSAILLSLMIWKMARDPQVYKKILEEQFDILRQMEESDHGRLTWTEIQKMKYTWRVAQELMRIIPPVFGSFRQSLRDNSFGGYDIPKGWQILWVSCVTHMDGDLFEDPETFDPRRFEKNVTKPIPPYTYIAFGGGLHSCIGNEFARVETLTTIHNLVTKYEWSQLKPEEEITRQPMPYPSMGLPIKIKPRNSLAHLSV